MQALETDTQQALYTRAALEELLSWGAVDQLRAPLFLNAILRFHPTAEARMADWKRLVELYEDYDRIDRGDDLGYDDQGDGNYAPIDRLTALERAERDLEEALDAVAGVVPAAHPKAA